MKLIFLNICLLYFAANPIISQQTTYLDYSGRMIRQAEVVAVRTTQNEAKKTEQLAAQIDATSTYEKNSRVTLAPFVEKIDFSYYVNTCNSYTNKLEKTRCQKEVLYYRDAHKTITNLLSVNTLFKIKKGHQELIKQKYFGIRSTIAARLEYIRDQAEYKYTLSNKTPIKN